MKRRFDIFQKSSGPAKTSPYSAPVVLPVADLLRQMGNYEDLEYAGAGSVTAFDELKRAQWVKSDESPVDALMSKAHDNQTPHREAFIKFLETRLASPDTPSYTPSDPDIRCSDPVKAAVKMEDFLGKHGLALFKKASEEEVTSKAYLQAVFNKSASYYEGERWTERPILYIGGASASGKSYSTQVAIKSANGLFQTSGEPGGNFVIAKDGGVAREVCQMRNLIIEAAIAKGFTGLIDLQDQTKKLIDPIKKKVAKAARLTTHLGVATPTTFASGKELISLFKKWALSWKKKINDDEVNSNDKTAFIMVDCDRKDPEKQVLFQKAVEFMGNRRAFKKEWPDGKRIEWGLNQTGRVNIPESKIYERRHFGSGLKLSRWGLSLFKKASVNGYSMVAINDLVIKCPNQDGTAWIDAEPNSPDTQLLSQRVFERWKLFKAFVEDSSNDSKLHSLLPLTKLQPMYTSELTLPAATRYLPKEKIKEAAASLKDYLDLCDGLYKGIELKRGEEVIIGSKYVKAMILTSPEVEIARAFNMLEKKETSNTHRPKDKQAAIKSILSELNNWTPKLKGFSQFSAPENLDKLKSLLQQVDSKLSKLGGSIGRAERKFSSSRSTRVILDNLQRALNKTIEVIELKNEKGTVEYEDPMYADYLTSDPAITPTEAITPAVAEDTLAWRNATY